MVDPVFASPAMAEAHFYQAFAQLDVESMQQVWLDSPEVFCVHPGAPALLGIGAVLNSWQSMFSQAAPLALSYKLIQHQAHKDIALHLVEESISPREGGRQGLVLASNCYVRSAQGWRLLSHHGSAVAQAVSAHRAVMH